MAWQHFGSQHAQPVDHLTRCVESSHMSIAGGKTTVGPGPRRRFLHRHEQLCCRLGEVAEEEVRDAKHPEVVAPTVARAEAERCLNLLDPKIGLSRPDTENAPQMPRPREARIERERAIDQCYLGSDILAEKGERKRGMREDARVVACGFHGLPRAFAAPRRFVSGSSPQS